MRPRLSCGFFFLSFLLANGDLRIHGSELNVVRKWREFSYWPTDFVRRVKRTYIPFTQKSISKFPLAAQGGILGKREKEIGKRE